MQEDPTISQIKNSISSSNQELTEELTKRFIQDLQNNMLFFVFNFICSQIDQNTREFDTAEDKRQSDKFFEVWLSEVKKGTKEEISEINKRLNEKEMAYLSAISSFSIPSTEDYQKIYNEALKNVKTLFEKATNF